MRLWIALILNLVALMLWEFLDVVTEIPRLLQGAVLLVLVVPFALLVAAGMRGASRVWESPTADPAPAAEPVPESRTVTLIDPVTQDEYVALLVADRTRQRGFVWQPERSPYCRHCHQRAGVLEIVHPIWDGPFDDAGSGIVDTRLVPLCPCEQSESRRLDDLGLVLSELPLDARTTGWSPVAGRPIRLPWLDRLPVRLHPELFDRPAFHRLSVRVERWRPSEHHLPRETQ